MAHIRQARHRPAMPAAKALVGADATRDLRCSRLSTYCLPPRQHNIDKPHLTQAHIKNGVGIVYAPRHFICLTTPIVRRVYPQWLLPKQVVVHPHPALHLERPNHHRARPYSTAESPVRYARSVGTSQTGQEYR